MSKIPQLTAQHVFRWQNNSLSFKISPACCLVFLINKSDSCFITSGTDVKGKLLRLRAAAWFLRFGLKQWKTLFLNSPQPRLQRWYCEFTEFSISKKKKDVESKQRLDLLCTSCLWRKCRMLPWCDACFTVHSRFLAPQEDRLQEVKRKQ